MALRTLLIQAIAVVLIGSGIGLVNNLARGSGGLALTGASLAPPDEGACAPTGPEFISTAEARRLVGREDVVFVDARSAEEYLAGHIPGALHLPYSEGMTVPQALLDRFKGCRTVVAYCDLGECDASIRLGERLLAAGVGQVRVLSGGWPEWYAQGNPVAGAGGMSSEAEGQPLPEESAQ